MFGRTFAFIYLALAVAPASIHATVYLLLDSRLKKSPLEQVIYKFVPLTNATEVELSYLHDFLSPGRAAEYLKKIKKGSHALYLSADAWPSAALQAFFASANMDDYTGKMDFLAAPGDGGATAIPRPKQLLGHHDLWRRFAELTGARYAGYFEKHYLDATTESLGKSSWASFQCVHSAGRIFSAGRASPITAGADGFRLNFRLESQLGFLGRLVCINTPRADTFFEVSTYRGDVELSVGTGRFSAWNEAQPLRLHIMSTQLITAPLFLEVIPEINQDQTEFFFQGDRISCKERKCIKKAARFLMPALTGLAQDFELAIRASGDSYFRGQLKLRSGEIEVARSEVRFFPASWLTEFAFALKNPSEYKSYFLKILLVIIAAIVALVILVAMVRRWLAWLASRQKPSLPRQTSAGTRIEPEKDYRLTASQNPFGCELAYFGGIIELRISGEKVRLKSGERGEELYDVKNFKVRLADGYVLKLKRPAEAEFILEAYLAS